MSLLERILKQNPWWDKKQIAELKNYKERLLFEEIWQYKDKPQIIAVLGLRRVGKTVLLFQIIEKLLKKVKPERILFFSFDELLGKDPDIIEKILNTYENDILKEELDNVFIFFDEVNYLENWQVVLKRYYDMPGRIKFFVSGSSSIFLKKTKESLAGRIYEFILRPLDFQEYLYLKNIKIRELKKQQLKLKKELSKYFLNGTLPEIIAEEDFSQVKKYTNSLIDKIIFYDLPKVYDIDEPEILKNILSLVAQKPGMLLEYQKLADVFKVSYQTISKYVNYLERAYLIRLIYNFRGSPIARARKLKKAYLGSISLASAFIDSEQELFSIRPFLAENIVCNQVQAQWFWRKYNELDFYHKEKPIEVKYTDKKPDIKNNLLAVKSLKKDSLLVVTINFEASEILQGIKVSYIPLWKWLLSEK